MTRLQITRGTDDFNFKLDGRHFNADKEKREVSMQSSRLLINRIMAWGVLRNLILFCTAKAAQGKMYRAQVLRRQGLAVVVAIVLQIINLQMTSAHDSNALLPPPQDLESHANLTLEVEECSSCPPVNCIDTCVIDDTVQYEDSIVTFRSISECENELTNVIADKNRTIQRMEKEYRKVLNETYHKLDALEEKLGKQERQMKTTEERYQASRRQVTEIDEELRRMHAAAVNQYLNTTLMIEDAWYGVGKAFTKAKRRAERRWGPHFRRLRHFMYERERKVYRIRMETRSYLQPRMASFKRNAKYRWSKSTFVRPLADKLETMVKGAAYELYRPLKPIVDDVEVACRLTTISAIEEGSKTILNFLEKDEKLHMEREHARNKRKDPMHHRLEYMRRNRRHESRNRDREEFIRYEIPKPSLLNLKARTFFKYALDNSNQIYADIVKLIPLALTLYFFRCCIIGSLSWFIGIPSPMIWAIAICRMLIKRRKAQ